MKSSFITIKKIILISLVNSLPSLPVPSSGLPPTTNAQHRVQSSQVPHPQQESRGAAAVRSPLPPQMRAQSQNFSYRPPAPQQSAGRRHAPETNSRGTCIGQTGIDN